MTIQNLNQNSAASTIKHLTWGPGPSPQRPSLAVGSGQHSRASGMRSTHVGKATSTDEMNSIGPTAGGARAGGTGHSPTRRKKEASRPASAPPPTTTTHDDGRTTWLRRWRISLRTHDERKGDHRPTSSCLGQIDDRPKPKVAEQEKAVIDVEVGGGVKARKKSICLPLASRRSSSFFFCHLPCALQLFSERAEAHLFSLAAGVAATARGCVVTPGTVWRFVRAWLDRSRDRSLDPVTVLRVRRPRNHSAATAARRLEFFLELPSCCRARAAAEQLAWPRPRTSGGRRSESLGHPIHPTTTQVGWPLSLFLATDLPPCGVSLSSSSLEPRLRPCRCGDLGGCWRPLCHINGHANFA